MASTIEMIAVLKPKPEKLERVRQLFADLAKQVNENEKGCQQFSVYTQTKAKGTPNVILHERYVDQEAFNHHVQTPYFLVMAKAMVEEDLLRDPLEIEEACVALIAGS
ncbi:MAG: hypothetical protein M1830_010025 [Pleopsidium flavum]|nr:MAG: hypothetical protein M1830_010025 [Pleopsidium flavum]